MTAIHLKVTSVDCCVSVVQDMKCEIVWELKKEPLQWVTLDKRHNHAMPIAIHSIWNRKAMFFQSLIKHKTNLSNTKMTNAKLREFSERRQLRTFIKANSFRAASRDK